MHHILAKRHIPVLASFGMSNVLLVFDFDGTLAPIVNDPTAARIRKSTRQLLARVAARYPCVVISGRSRDDVADRLARLPIADVAGNHGLEPWAERERYKARVQEWIHQLSPQLNSITGVAIEDKTYSLTVHYRNARRRATAVRTINRAVRGLRGARPIAGALATSVVPRGAPTKAAALRRATEMFACQAAIYVGDDGTDEEAFSAFDDDRLLGIRVGLTSRSCAKFGLKNQREIDQLLKQLLAIRSGPEFTRPFSRLERRSPRAARSHDAVHGEHQHGEPVPRTPSKSGVV